MCPPLCQVLLLVCFGLGVGFSTAFSGTELAQHRVLLGSDAVFDEEQLSYFDLPENAEILVQSQTDCPDPLPVEEQANNGLLCGFVLRARECLNYTETQPFWFGRDCTGQTCTAVNSPFETECIMGNYGVHIDVKNQSRAATCGLDPADESWLSPAINPASNTCSVVTPKGVRSDTWAECVDGIPRLQYRLTFDKNRVMPKDRPYSCIVSPMCLHGKPRKFHSMMVCYAEGVESPSSEQDYIGESLDSDVETEKIVSFSEEITSGGENDAGKRSNGVAKHFVVLGVGLGWFLLCQITLYISLVV